MFAIPRHHTRLSLVLSEDQHITIPRKHYTTLMDLTDTLRWDMAKFEVCCHKFADLSEYGYGVSILNDSKYGFATCGNLMRLSLLRAPNAPDAHADMGTFALLHYPL